jgi:hypothetical protein
MFAAAGRWVAANVSHSARMYSMSRTIKSANLMFSSPELAMGAVLVAPGTVAAAGLSLSKIAIGAVTQPD